MQAQPHTYRDGLRCSCSTTADSEYPNTPPAGSYAPRELQVHHLIVIQAPRGLRHTHLQRAIFPPDEYLAKVYRASRHLALLFELLQVAANLAVCTRGVVNDDEILQGGYGRLLDVALCGVCECGEGGREGADVC